jgi:hypothetical protein
MYNLLMSFLLATGSILFAPCSSMSQDTRAQDSRADSIAQRRAGMMQKEYSLSSDQVARIMALDKEKMAWMRQLRQKQVTDRAQHSSTFLEGLKKFDTALRAILTEAQYEKYKMQELKITDSLRSSGKYQKGNG